MRRALVAFSVIALMAGLPALGHAQGLNASFAGDMGGVGIQPNGTGFTGALGDPAFLAAQAAPTPAAPGAPYGVVRRGGVPGGTVTAPAAPPGAFGQAPGGPPVEYYYTPPAGR